MLGLMGVGKSTVGRLVANALGRPMSDSDESIMTRCGATVKELQERLGTDGMHRLESEHLLAALREDRPSVICAAASVVDDDRCRRALREPSAFTVWLRGDPAMLARRFGSGPHRPVLDTHPEELLRRQAAERSDEFAEVARLTLDVNDRSPDELARSIVSALA